MSQSSCQERRHSPILIACFATVVVALGCSKHASESRKAARQPEFEIQGDLLPTFQRVGVFQAEADFTIGLGRSDGGEVYAYYQDNRPGDMLSGLNILGSRGIDLPDGIYRWSFMVRRGDEPPHLPGSPVFRLSVWDVTADEKITERVVHASDFETGMVWYTRCLLQSTAGREGHRFEPRVFWEGFVDGFVDWVALDRVAGYSVVDLEAKALALNDALKRNFLDPIPHSAEQGLLVARNKACCDNKPEERGDSATWTSYYVASQAFRLAARPGDEEALQNLERGFRALHALHQVTGQPGIIARYADPAGNWHYVGPEDGLWHAGRCLGTGSDGKLACEEWSNRVISEDIYTAFVFAVGVGYEKIRDPDLKSAIAEDIRAVARHFLDHDFGFETEGARVDLNPYFAIDEAKLDAVLSEFLDPAGKQVETILEAYHQFDQLRTRYNNLARLSTLASLLTFGCLPSFSRIPNPLIASEAEVVDAMARRDPASLKRLIPIVLPQTYERVVWLRGFLRTSLSDLRQAIDCLGRLPNTDPGPRVANLFRFGDLVLAALDDFLAKLPPGIARLEDLKFNASHAIEAAHILCVARSIWPDDFTTAYYDALQGPKQLLPTMKIWADAAERFGILVGGDLGADRARQGVRHRTFSALYNLIALETSEEIRAVYRRILDGEWSASSDEGNAFYDVIREAADASEPGSIPTDLGVTGWALSILPMVKTGYPVEFWRNLYEDLDAFTGQLLDWDGSSAHGFGRDPLSPNLRSGEMFFWQRNPRSFGHDSAFEQAYFPSLDYLLPYWMARAHDLPVAAPADPAAVATPRLRPAQFVASSGQIGLTIGRGTSIHRKCKQNSGFFPTPPELGKLPGPYGGVQVGWDGAHIGAVHILMVITDNAWNLSVNPQPEGVYWGCEVCRAGGIEKPGSEIKFQIDILDGARPAHQAPFPTVPYTIADLPAVLTFEYEEGQEPPPQVFSVREANDRPAYFFAEASTDQGTPPIWLSPTGDYAPAGVRVRPSVINLSAREKPYTAKITVIMPGAANSPETVAVDLRVRRPLAP